MNKSVFSATLVACLLIFTPNAAASYTYSPKPNNQVGLYFGGQIWQSDASGLFGEENTLIDFNLKKEQQFNYFFAVVHPLPLLPNVRISSTTLDTTGKSSLTQDFNFGGVAFPLSGSETGVDPHTGSGVNSTTDVEFDATLKISYIDYTFFYQLFNNDVFSFDLGVTARSFNNDFAVTATSTIVTIFDEAEHYDHVHEATEETTISTTTGRIKTDDIEPMLFVASTINLSLKGLSFFAQGDYLLIDDHRHFDYQLGVNYDLVNNKMGNFAMTFGYRVVKMAFKDLDTLYSDLEFKGAFVGVMAHF